VTGAIDLEDVAGLRLLVSDVTGVVLLLNEARYRTMERVFGIPREQANVITGVFLLVLVAASQERASKALKTPPKGPSATDWALGAGVMREALHGIAGPSFDREPLFGTLLALAAVAHISRPVVSKSITAVKGKTHQARVGFEHRYGHHIRRHRDRLQKLTPNLGEQA
jgi:hypothetical protein